MQHLYGLLVFNMKYTTIIISIILFILIQSTVSAYFIEPNPRPLYCDDCIIPLKEEIMQNQETYQIFVIMSMLIVNILKVVGMYYYTKQTTPDVKFNQFYIVSAVLGIFLGYTIFIKTISYEGTYIDTFMLAGAYALGSNLLFDFAGKLKANSEN